MWKPFERFLLSCTDCTDYISVLLDENVLKGKTGGIGNTNGQNGRLVKDWSEWRRLRRSYSGQKRLTVNVRGWRVHHNIQILVPFFWSLICNATLSGTRTSFYTCRLRCWIEVSWPETRSPSSVSGTFSASESSPPGPGWMVSEVQRSTMWTVSEDFVVAVDWWGLFREEHCEGRETERERNTETAGARRSKGW